MTVHVGRSGLYSGDVLDGLTGLPGGAASDDTGSLEDVGDLFCLCDRREGSQRRQGRE